MTALHSGKAKHEKIDAPKMAVFLRGGMLPHAYVSPAAMRATRDRRRRRLHVRRKRAEWLGHSQQTHRPYHLPDIGKKIAYKANRDGVAERLADPAGQHSIAVALALLGHDDERLRDLELSILKAAKQHAANTRALLRTGPGMGEFLSLVLRYEIHDIQRLPRVQDVVSYCRLVTCAKESAGTRDGTAGTKLGNAYLTGAFAEAAVFFLRNTPPGQTLLVRLETRQGKGKALTGLTHKLARAVYQR